MVLIADGSVRGQSSGAGPAGWAVVLRGWKRKYVTLESGRVAESDINTMELTAVWWALTYLAKHLDDGVLAAVLTDSLYTVQCLSESVKPERRHLGLVMAARGLLNDIGMDKVVVKWVSRNRTRPADLRAKKESSLAARGR